VITRAGRPVTHARATIDDVTPPILFWVSVGLLTFAVGVFVRLLERTRRPVASQVHRGSDELGGRRGD